MGCERDLEGSMENSPVDPPDLTTHMLTGFQEVFPKNERIDGRSDDLLIAAAAAWTGAWRWNSVRLTFSLCY